MRCCKPGARPRRETGAGWRVAVRRSVVGPEKIALLGRQVTGRRRGRSRSNGAGKWRTNSWKPPMFFEFNSREKAYEEDFTLNRAGGKFRERFCRAPEMVRFSVPVEVPAGGPQFVKEKSGPAFPIHEDRRSGSRAPRGSAPPSAQQRPELLFLSAPGRDAGR